MLNVMRAATLCVCILGLSASSARATTYDYVGNPLNVIFPCCSSAPGLTGSVTFDFNTFDFSGTVFLSTGHVSALQLGGGTLGNYLLFDAYFVLDEGAITNWSLQSAFAGWSSFSSGGTADYVEIGGGCGPLCYIASNQEPGVWTPVDLAPVPGPTVGAGASSFALALFLGWLVRRRVTPLTR
jgi:hypothetical protein